MSESILTVDPEIEILLRDDAASTDPIDETATTTQQAAFATCDDDLPF